MNLVEKTGRQFVKPPTRVPPWRWAEQHLTVDKTSPFPGRFRADVAAWTKQPMEDFADNRVRHIAVRCAAQSSKTQTMMVCLAWAVAEDPGPMMWVMAAQDEAKTFSRTRLIPTLESCDPVRAQLPDDRHTLTTAEIDFPNAPLVINGANSKSKLQSKPIRWLFLDEVRNYPPGAYEMVLKRITAFWNAREVMLSTADLEGDHVDRAFEAGNQCFYYVPCPKCEHKSPLVWKQLKWDETEATRPGHEWNYDEVAKTIRYECPMCGHRVLDEMSVRRWMAANGEWVAHNKNAPSNRRSYTWNALLPPWIRWRDLVEEFLRAKLALQGGDIEPLKSFVNERLGEAWREENLWDADLKPPGGFKQRETWPEEVYRLMTVDVQQNYFRYVVRSWAKDGKSRMYEEGRVLTWDGLREKQEQLKPGWRTPMGDWKERDDFVVIDSGFRATDVYEQCCTFGWRCLKGEEDRHFMWVLNDGKRVYRAYAKPVNCDPTMGRAGGPPRKYRYAVMVRWSNPTVKDFLYRLKTGQGVYWGMADDVSRSYIDELNGEAKVKRKDAQNRDRWLWVEVGRRGNHAFDCECMQVVCAMQIGLLQGSAAKEERKEPAEKA